MTCSCLLTTRTPHARRILTSCQKPSTAKQRGLRHVTRLYSSAVTPVTAPNLGTFTLPQVQNEPMLNYAPGSQERKELQSALKRLRSKAQSGSLNVPSVVDSEEIRTHTVKQQIVPFEKSLTLATYSEADPTTIRKAIKQALKAKPEWEAMPFNDRAAIFLKAADLLSTKYRYDVLAATVMGQGKNAWQAEIDAAAELCDFWRFNCHYAAKIYADQPTENALRTWNRLEYRPLEGFVVAYSPFNFTAIGGNLVASAALMGNVILWKPSPMASYSNYLIYQILREAGLPDGVVQFLPADAELMTKETFHHPEFAGLHFTGSTTVFRKLWKDIGNNIENYKSYPRIVGETGGKNMHFIHESADVRTAVMNTIRGAFEYSGQKCSATSRAYVPDTLWDEFKTLLTEEVKKLKVGPADDFGTFASAVINQDSYNKITKYLDEVGTSANPHTKVLVGGQASDANGYFIHPTVLVTTDPKSSTIVNELFGPVLTVYVYPAKEFEKTLHLAESSTHYGLTGSIFAQDRKAVITASNILRNAAGNFYINDKSTGAVVGQQPFGGARASGTNDKAGSGLNLLRWVSPRTIKENFLPLDNWSYPSNAKEELASGVM